MGEAIKKKLKEAVSDEEEGTKRNETKRNETVKKGEKEKRGERKEYRTTDYYSHSL